MDYRGPILIVFGMSLIMSPIAVHLAQSAASSAPTEVLTRGEMAAACDARSIETGSGARIGCVNNLERAETRRIAAGGALFLAADG